MIYTHVFNQDDVKIVSPLDRLCGEQFNSTVEDVIDNESQVESSRESPRAVRKVRRRWRAFERLGHFWLAVKRSTIQETTSPLASG